MQFSLSKYNYNLRSTFDEYGLTLTTSCSTGNWSTFRVQTASLFSSPCITEKQSTKIRSQRLHFLQNFCGGIIVQSSFFQVRYICAVGLYAIKFLLGEVYSLPLLISSCCFWCDPYVFLFSLCDMLTWPYIYIFLNSLHL